MAESSSSFYGRLLADNRKSLDLETSRLATIERLIASYEAEVVTLDGVIARWNANVEKLKNNPSGVIPLNKNNMMKAAHGEILKKRRDMEDKVNRYKTEKAQQLDQTERTKEMIKFLEQTVKKAEPGAEGGRRNNRRNQRTRGKRGNQSRRSHRR
jgi:hypothetical protein